ncbi:MAG: hypothetical protein NTY70_19170 [Burkholderiales bacterium]|nr:hypothetical protein [Burkholderiales bacterium]
MAGNLSFGDDGVQSLGPSHEDIEEERRRASNRCHRQHDEYLGTGTQNQRIGTDYPGFVLLDTAMQARKTLTKG